jgi:uncharacterized protein with HEPN domain
MAPVDIAEGRRITDMLEAMGRIRQWADGKETADIRSDALLSSAIRYEFLVISEASRHLQASTKDRNAHIPSRKVANLGNILRHAYQVVDIETLLQIAHDEFPALIAVLETEQARLHSPPPESPAQ